MYDTFLEQLWLLLKNLKVTKKKYLPRLMFE